MFKVGIWVYQKGLKPDSYCEYVAKQESFRAGSTPGMGYLCLNLNNYTHLLKKSTMQVQEEKQVENAQ